MEDDHSTAANLDGSQAAPRSRSALFRVRDIVTAQDSTFTPTERLVALCIAFHMGGQERAWPSRSTIEQWTGLGHSAVAAVLRRLCGRDGLFAVQQGGARPGNRYDANTYTLRPEPELSVSRPPEPSELSARKPPRRGPPGGSLPPGGHEGAATRTRGGRQAASQEINEGIIEGINNGSTLALARVVALGPVPVDRPDIARAIREACDDWQRILGGKAPGGRIGKAIKPLAGRWTELRSTWCSYLEAQQQYASPQAFIAKLGVWQAQAGGGPALEPKMQRSADALRRFATKRDGQ